MAEVLEVKKIGESIGVILTEEAAEQLHVREGDKLYVLQTPEGAILARFDPDTAEALRHAEDTIRLYRDDLQELAK